MTRSRNRIDARTARRAPATAESCRTALQRAVFIAVPADLVGASPDETNGVRTAIERTRRAGIPVLAVSMMTLDEIVPLATALGLGDPMVIEGGGAIARRAGSGWSLDAVGPPADVLLDVIREVEDRSGANLLVYSAMSDSEASSVSGLSGQSLEASRRRRFSEPFVVESGDLESIRVAATEVGFSLRREGEFLHLHRKSDERKAFTRLRRELRCDVVIGIGCSRSDAELLALADARIIVPRRDGRADPELLAEVPDARVAPEPAPHGWALALDEVCRGLPFTRRPTAPRAVSGVRGRVARRES